MLYFYGVAVKNTDLWPGSLMQSIPFRVPSPSPYSFRLLNNHCIILRYLSAFASTNERPVFVSFGRPKEATGRHQGHSLGFDMLQ